MYKHGELSGSFPVFNARKPSVRKRPWRPSNASGQQELSPFVHQHPASLEKGCAPIGSLDSVGDTVRQRLVRDLLRHIRAFRRPIGEGAAEPVVSTVATAG